MTEGLRMTTKGKAVWTAPRSGGPIFPYRNGFAAHVCRSLNPADMVSNVF
jgi:hypothetical protein